MRSTWAAMILGLVLALIGLVLFIGGIWLAILGGSIYYLLAGLGLLASGYLLFRGNPNGAYLYRRPYGQLDLSAGLRLSRLFGPIPSDPELTFDVQNLNKAKLASYFQFTNATNDYYAQGTTYLLSLRGRF